MVEKNNARAVTTYRQLVIGFLVVLVTLFAYYPAWNGTPIWDDDLHLGLREPHSLNSLAHIWIQPKTTQQYHPLVDTIFWFEGKIFRTSMLGYHLINIVLHIGSALLLLV